jgi:hypothetical protein
MGFVVGMHLASLMVLAHSFGFVSVPKFDGSVGVFIDEPRPPEPPPPVIPDAPLTDPTIYVGPPQPIPVDPVSDDAITPPTDVVTGQGEGEGGSAVVIPAIVNVRADPRHPFSQPPYPPTDRREGNQGSVDVEIYVLANGRVGDARIVKAVASSASTRSRSRKRDAAGACCRPRAMANRSRSGTGCAWCSS